MERKVRGLKTEFINPLTHYYKFSLYIEEIQLSSTAVITNSLM